MTKDLNKRIALAGFLIIIGTALLIRNLHLLPVIPEYVFSWPMLLILFGSFILITKQKIIPSLFFIGAGIYFLMPGILGIDLHDMHIFWPLLFIAAGIVMFLKSGSYHNDQKALPEKIDPDIDYLDLDSVLSLHKKIILTQEFKGGKVNNVFGGCELNFSNAKLAPGKNYLELNTVFGGCTLIIPADWNVNVEMVSVFGGFADKRQVMSIPAGEPSLIIRGACVFGGGEIISR